jgi:hypothetical protein
MIVPSQLALKTIQMVDVPPVHPSRQISTNQKAKSVMSAYGFIHLLHSLIKY